MVIPADLADHRKVLARQYQAARRRLSEAIILRHLPETRAPDDMTYMYSSVLMSARVARREMDQVLELARRVRRSGLDHLIIVQDLHDILRTP